MGHFIANRRGRTRQSSVELGPVVQLEQGSAVLAARVEPVVQVVQAEGRLLALAARIAQVEPAEGKPSVVAMACQQVVEALVAVRFRLVSTLVVAQPFDSLVALLPVPCSIRLPVLATPLH